MIFADLPGYGFAKISKSISAGWPAFIEPYLAIRSRLRAVRVPGRRQCASQGERPSVDGLAAGPRRRDFVVAATKIDRLSGNERTRNLLALKKGLDVEDVLPVSAKTGVGIKELWARIEAAAASEPS